MTGHLTPAPRQYAEALPMSASYFSMILREHGTAPHARSLLLAGTGLSEDELAQTNEIALGQQLRQIRNTVGVLDPTWAAVTGSRLSPATHGPIGIAAVSAPSLRDSLAVMTRFSQVRAPHFQLRAYVGADEVRLVPEDRLELSEEERRPLLDIVLLSTQAMLETVLGRPIYEARFELPYAPHDYVSRYADWFHAPVRFECREPAVVLPARWLSVQSPLADPIMFETALQSLLARQRLLYGDQVLAARVEQLMAQRGSRLTLQSAAALLGVSSRTLTRRLGGEGTSFATLLEENRKARAITLLKNADLAIAEIAYVLGYEDAANFGRAFRRWFGMSPSRYRRE